MGGGFFKAGVEAYRSGDLAVIRTRATPIKPRGGIDGTPPISGAATDKLPVTLISDRDRGGGKFRSFFEDFYNRVYFLPPNVQFGTMSSTTRREVLAWNAHLSATPLTSVVITNGTGLSLSGPSVPYTFKPLETVTYALTAGPDGPPILDAAITFTFGATESFILKAAGIRAKVPELTPNWRKSYQIEYQFKTDIFTSRSGKEQRRALRTTPRKKISYESTPTGGQLRTFSELMASWHDNTIILPEIPRQAVLAKASKAGETSVELEADAPSWAVEGATVVIDNSGQRETRQVASAADREIVFGGVSARDWPVGTKIYPGVSGRLVATLRSTRETNTAGVVQVEMDVTPASEPVIDIPSAPAVFNGRELFTLKPNWTQRPDVSYESHREQIDYGRGRIATFKPVNFSTRILRQTYTGRAYEDMNKIREHFTRMHGQRGEFYMPTWERDIVPSRLSPATSNTIRVAGTAFAEQYKDSTVFKAVMVQFADGLIQYNTVQSVYSVDDANGLDSVVQVKDAWSQDVSPDNVRIASWLLVWRHATDTLTIEWLTNSVGQCQLTVSTLEDLA